MNDKSGNTILYVILEIEKTVENFSESQDLKMNVAELHEFQETSFAVPAVPARLGEALYSS